MSTVDHTPIITARREARGPTAATAITADAKCEYGCGVRAGSAASATKRPTVVVKMRATSMGCRPLPVAVDPMVCHATDRAVLDVRAETRW
jgi:hypothetical protein